MLIHREQITFLDVELCLTFNPYIHIYIWCCFKANCFTSSLKINYKVKWSVYTTQFNLSGFQCRICICLGWFKNPPWVRTWAEENYIGKPGRPCWGQSFLRLAELPTAGSNLNRRLTVQRPRKFNKFGPCRRIFTGPYILE